MIIGTINLALPGMTSAWPRFIDPAAPSVSKNIGTKAANGHFMEENANWNVLTDRSEITGLFLSDNKTTLWIGTKGGLEERNASNGQLRKVYTNQNGLPDNYVYVILSDTQGGIWVGTGGGLAHYHSDGTWEIFDTLNSALPDDLVASLLLDGQGGIWIGTFNDGLSPMYCDSA